MILLKNILKEISIEDETRLLNKIRNNEYSFVAKGDNGKVYAINGEDLLFKTEREKKDLETNISLHEDFIKEFFDEDEKNEEPLEKKDFLAEFFQELEDEEKQEATSKE